MSFLDPKEQVIDLQLTSFGRYLLSTGQFKPVQYAFFDDDIVYDQQFAGTGSELQNEIEPRIQENTPRLEAQTLYRGAELAVFSTNPNLAYNLMPGVLADKKNKVNLSQTPDKSYIFVEPLGNSAYNSKNIAAWNIGFYKAELSSSYTIFTGSNNEIPTTFIPQLNCDIKYNAEVYTSTKENQNTPGTGEEMSDIESFHKLAKQETINTTNIPIVFEEDKSYMIYKDDFALLKIEEANTELLKENFEIEVFERIPIVNSFNTGSYSETLKRLYFAGDEVADVDRVDYYFDIDIDFEIDETEYCELRRQADKIKNIYIDKVFNCESRKETLLSLNIYGTKENQPPEEPC